MAGESLSSRVFPPSQLYLRVADSPGLAEAVRLRTLLNRTLGGSGNNAVTQALAVRIAQAPHSPL